MTSISLLSMLALAALVLAALAGCRENGHDASLPLDGTQSPVATADRPTVTPHTPRPTETPVVLVTPEPMATPAAQPYVTATRSEETQQPSTTAPPPAGTPLPTATPLPLGDQPNYIAVAAGVDYTCALKANGAAFCVGTNEETVPAPDVTLKSISAGTDHACGIKTDGEVVCWGSNKFWDEYSGKADPPDGDFASVSTGVFHTCGVRTGGVLACWGLNDLRDGNEGLADPPGGAFASVSAGWLHTCGVKTDGTVTCWSGHNDFKLAPPGLENPISPPPGDFLSVSVDGLQSCGLRTNGELVCWGHIAVGSGGDCTFFCAPEMAPAQEVELPAATFQYLPDGGAASCGIASDGSILCWGWPLDQVNPPEGEFTDVSVGTPHACGLRADGAIVCWVWGFHIGDEVPGSESEQFCLADRDGSVTCPGEPELEMEAMRLSGRIIERYRAVYSHRGIDYPCGYRLDDSLVCWTEDQDTFFDPAPTPVEAFAASDGDSVCWLLPDGAVACWGIIGSPKGEFQSISLGGSHEQFGCGVRTDNTLACWGNDSYGWGQLLPPAGEYKSVSAADGHACAIKTDNTVDCWGNVDDGAGCWGSDPDDFEACVDHMEAGDPWTPLSGTFLAISGSYCGVHTEGHIECEIGDRERRWWNIECAFQSVGVGSWAEHYACGLRLDGTLECWGDNSHGRAAPPDGQFQSISVAAQHACGVRVDGTVACWGGKETYIGGGHAAVMPPGGTFRSVSVGGRPNHGTHYSCGIRTDGTPVCWGNPETALLQALVAEAATTTTKSSR